MILQYLVKGLKKLIRINSIFITNLWQSINQWFCNYPMCRSELADFVLCRTKQLSIVLWEVSETIIQDSFGIHILDAETSSAWPLGFSSFRIYFEIQYGRDAKINLARLLFLSNFKLVWNIFFRHWKKFKVIVKIMKHWIKTNIKIYYKK